MFPLHSQSKGPLQFTVIEKSFFSENYFFSFCWQFNFQIGMLIMSMGAYARDSLKQVWTVPK